MPVSQLPEPEPFEFSDSLLHSVSYAPLPQDAFAIPGREEYSVIGIVKKQIITKHLKMSDSSVKEGLRNGTVNKIAVIERHHASDFHACAYITGYGLRHGAVATTVAHDSHNIIVIGDNDADMFAAVEQIKAINGGYTIVSDGEVIGSLPLELGGLMSLKGADEFIEQLERVISKAYEMGVDRDIDPFITLSFMALPVIPEIRITDCGLFDVEKFEFTDQE